MDSYIIRIIISSIVTIVILLNYKKINKKICNKSKLGIFILALILFFIEIGLKSIFEYQNLLSSIIISVINLIYLIIFIYLIVNKIKS